MHQLMCHDIVNATEWQLDQIHIEVHPTISGNAAHLRRISRTSTRGGSTIFNQVVDASTLDTRLVSKLTARVRTSFESACT